MVSTCPRTLGTWLWTMELVNIGGVKSVAVWHQECQTWNSLVGGNDVLNASSTPGVEIDWVCQSGTLQNAT